LVSFLILGAFSLHPTRTGQKQGAFGRFSGDFRPT